jgi:hypothetical protein
VASTPPVRRPSRIEKFDTPYKAEAFAIWYKMGKCGAGLLYPALPPNSDGDVPTIGTVQQWISKDFIPQGDALDLQVKAAMDQRLIQEKIKMLEEHTQVAKEMQDMALEYLRDNRENLKVPNAVRMLVEGIRIERDSRGIPAMMEKLVDRSDEDLMNELKEIVAKTPVTFEAVDDEE